MSRAVLLRRFGSSLRLTPQTALKNGIMRGARKVDFPRASFA
jgi:hypothetical protein